jgi:hypothetical protein
MSTPGQALVEALSGQLGPHMAWTEAELATLAMIEGAADRRAVFQVRFDESAADPKSSPSRLATLSGELRLIDNMIHKWILSLDPNDNAAKSARHVHAANARWHRASG